MPFLPLKKKGIALLGGCLLAIGFSCFAFAEAAIPLNEIGIRYYPAAEEQCITQTQLPEDSQELMGMDEAPLLSAMERSRIFLICLAPDGRQVSLRLTDKPGEIFPPNVFDLQATEKEQLLTSLARAGHYSSATWQEDVPGFALFSTYANQGASGDMAVHTLALSTLYLNQIYTFETDVIGRPIDETDAQLLLSVAGRALFLGAKEESEADFAAAPPLELPQSSLPTEENAVFSEEIGTIPLSLSPMPKTIGTTTAMLTGVTSPNVYVKYIINGKSSSRFKPGADGSFSVTMKGLAADTTNAVEVVAFDQGQSSSICFSLEVQWLSTPVVLSKTSGEVHEDSVTLTGLTLPDATVQLIRKQGDSTIAVQKDGSFQFDVSTKKTGDTTVTIRALSPGYRRNDVGVTLTRKLGAADELQALLRKAKAISYEKLAKSPSAYQNQVLEYEGVVTALANDHGQPCLLLTVSEGQSILILCGDLLSIELGQRLHILGAPLEGPRSLETPAGTAYPALELLTLVP